MRAFQSSARDLIADAVAETLTAGDSCGAFSAASATAGANTATCQVDAIGTRAAIVSDALSSASALSFALFLSPRVCFFFHVGCVVSCTGALSPSLPTPAALLVHPFSRSSLELL